MAVLNSRQPPAPFLTYLTVFKSRLGTINYVLPFSGFAFQPATTLSRRVRKQLSETVEVSLSDPGNENLLGYLVDKRLVGRKLRSSGRYAQFTLYKNDKWIAHDLQRHPLDNIRVYYTDVWLSDPRIRSNIGVPTPDNTDEIIELCYQLGFLSRVKNTWTSAGQLCVGLRSLMPEDNPMIIGMELGLLLRQILEKDGPLFAELVSELKSTSTAPRFKRDDVAKSLPVITQRAIKRAIAWNFPPSAIREGKAFLSLLLKTSSKRRNQSTGPGVLEHRTSPRLEWLTDVGALSKVGIEKNAFEYEKTADLALLDELCGETPYGKYWSDTVSSRFWRRAANLGTIREQVQFREVHPALLEGYRIMKRTVGPTAIREVLFAALLLAKNKEIEYDEMMNELVSWASSERSITLSGGRYSRKPELVHIADELLRRA